MSAGPVLGFELEWFDSTSGILKKMFLKFFLDDNTIEILQVYYFIGINYLFISSFNIICLITGNINVLKTNLLS